MRKSKHAKRIAELTEAIVDANNIIACRNDTIAQQHRAIAEWKENNEKNKQEALKLSNELLVAKGQLGEARTAIKALKSEIFETKLALAYADGINAHMKENEIVRELGAAIEQPTRSRRVPTMFTTDVQPLTASRSVGNQTNYGNKPTDWWDR